MSNGDTNNVSPWLLPGAILGGVLLLIGGITSGSVSTVLIALIATGFLVWTIKRRSNAG